MPVISVDCDKISYENQIGIKYLMFILFKIRF